MKFKVGDIIKGLPESNHRYTWTNEDMTKAEVLEEKCEGIRIRILEHKEKSQIRKEYDVVNSDKYFELVTEVGKDNNDLKELENERKKLENAVDLPKVYSINPQKRTTALIFPNGTITKVKKTIDDEFNPRLAFLTAFFQHYCGMTKNKANKYLANLETVEDKQEKKEKYKTLNLKEGDIVFHKYYGKGKVIELDESEETIVEVEFEKENKMFHSGDGKGKSSHCYWVDKSKLLPEEEVKGNGKD